MNFFLLNDLVGGMLSPLKFGSENLLDPFEQFG